MDNGELAHTQGNGKGVDPQSGSGGEAAMVQRMGCRRPWTSGLWRGALQMDQEALSEVRHVAV